MSEEQIATAAKQQGISVAEFKVRMEAVAKAQAQAAEREAKRRAEREAMEALRAALETHDGDRDDETLQGIVYAVGRDRFDPLRDWFKALYQVLLGADQGPRFGGFIALYGVEETIALIDSALAGDLAG